MADSGSGRRPARAVLDRRRLLAVAAALVVLVAVAAPFAAFHAVRCGVFGSGCETADRTPVPEPPRLRLLSALDIATRGSYVALGDSYSAGEGAYRIPADLAPGNRCHRTSQAYFHAVADTFPFHKGAAFWACSGATTDDVLRGRDGEPPQIDRVTGDTSLVTLSIGGNDVGFARVLAGCVIKLPWSKACENQGAQMAAEFPALRTALQRVVGAIVQRAPAARVIVLGYPRIFSETGGGGFDNISVADQRWLNGRAKQLDDLIRQVAQAADQRIVAAHGAGSVEYVDALYAFAGHEIGAEDPFVNGLDVNLSALTAEARSFHPNASGYRRLAQLVTRQITNGPARPILQYR